MIGQIDWRAPRCGRLEVHRKLIAGAQRECHKHQHRTRIALEAVRIQQAHHDRIVDDDGVPVELVETDEAAVQVIRTDILRQRVCCAVQLKATVRDAIADAPDGRPEIRIRFAQITWR